MEKVVDFLLEYYIVILVVLVILLITVIGFLADSKKKKKMRENANNNSSQNDLNMNNQMNNGMTGQGIDFNSMGNMNNTYSGFNMANDFNNNMNSQNMFNQNSNMMNQGVNDYNNVNSNSFNTNTTNMEIGNFSQNDISNYNQNSGIEQSNFQMTGSMAPDNMATSNTNNMGTNDTFFVPASEQTPKIEPREVVIPKPVEPTPIIPSMNRVQESIVSNGISGNQGTYVMEGNMGNTNVNPSIPPYEVNPMMVEGNNMPNNFGMAQATNNLNVNPASVSPSYSSVNNSNGVDATREQSTVSTPIMNNNNMPNTNMQSVPNYNNYNMSSVASQNNVVQGEQFGPGFVTGPNQQNINNQVNPNNNQM